MTGALWIDPVDVLNAEVYIGQAQSVLKSYTPSLISEARAGEQRRHPLRNAELHAVAGGGWCGEQLDDGSSQVESGRRAEG